MEEPEICGLCDEGHIIQPFALGPKDAEVVVVTNRKSSPKFQLELESQIAEVGLDPKTVRFLPVIKCRAFDVSLTSKQLKDHAAKYLIPELDAQNPKFILSLGNEALVATTGKSGIMKWRGKEYDRGRAKVISTVSPSAVHRNPGQKPAYMADLRLFANMVLDRPIGIPDPKYISAMDKASLQKVWRVLKMTEELYVDIETKGGEYYESYIDGPAKMISIAATCVVVKPDGTKGRVVIAIPLGHVQSPWRHRWREILALFAKYTRRVKKVVAHNSSFDCKWLMYHGSGHLMPTFDTMLAIALLNENVQKGLKPQAMARLGVPAWGIDTGDLDKYPIEEVLHYNVLDTWYMYWIKQQLIEEFKAQPRLARIFKFETMPAQRELIPIEIRGAWMDRKRLAERTPQARDRLAIIEDKIRAAAELPPRDDPDWPATFKTLKSGIKRTPLEENFNASQFARWMLFEWCGLEVLERGKPKADGSPGDPSMAEGVLMALRDQHPVVEAMLERVTAQKHLSSFFNPYNELIDDDDRIHTTFKLAGTVTGRLSSGKSDADKVSGSRGKMRGVNLQQVPRDPFIRGLFGAPPGWTFVESDYSQIELRVAAMLANERNMKHIYATGGDIHLATAARVTGLPESQVTKEIRKKVGKPVNFGFLYGMGAAKFQVTAFENYGSKFELQEAKEARDAYFQLFPDLLAWHSKQRRMARKYGRVESPLGRIRHLPDIYSPDQGVRAEAERQAINSPVQGFGSDLAVVAMIEINKKFKEQGIAGFCIGLVHDALNYEIRDDHLAWALPIIKDTMQDMDIVYRKFGTVVDIPIIADVAVGQHWGDKLELTEDQVYDFKMEYKGL